MERKNNMKRIFKISTLATLSLALTLSGCIKEIDPQQGYATSGQAGNAPGAFDNFVTAITNQLTSSYSFGPADYPWDYGYPTFFLMRDVMGQDMPLEDDGHNWYLNWYSCGTGLGPQYLYCQVPWTYYYSYIKSCNDVINLAGPEPSEAHRSGAGIAYAMRAFFYMDLARMSLAASRGPSWDDCIALLITGDARRASAPVMSTNSPGLVPTVTISFTLLIRFPVRLSLTVPRVTRTSVAMNASSGIPMS